MYEMRAEPDPVIPGAVVLWHAVIPGGQNVALCGHVLDPGVPATADTDADKPSDRYCSPCMAVVAADMATRG